MATLSTPLSRIFSHDTSIEPELSSPPEEDKIDTFIHNLFSGGVFRLGKTFEGTSGRIYKCKLGDPSEELAAEGLTISQELREKISLIEGSRDKVEKVALKLLHPENRRAFALEKSSGSHFFLGLSHENIASVYAAIVIGTDGEVSLKYNLTDIKDADTFVGYVQKWVEGKDLYRFYDTLLKSGNSLNADDIRLFINNITIALVFLNNNRLRHRDVSPSNILVGKEGLVLTDFDYSSKLLDHQEYIESRPAGTHGFMPPEVFFEGEHYSTSDLFSLGAIMYISVFGHEIFPERKKIDEMIRTEKRLDHFTELDVIKNRIWRTMYRKAAKTMQEDPSCLPELFVNVADRTCSKKLYFMDIPDTITSDPREKSALFDLLRSLLDFNPFTRKKGEEILAHPFLQMAEPPAKAE